MNINSISHPVGFSPRTKEALDNSVGTSFGQQLSQTAQMAAAYPVQVTTRVTSGGDVEYSAMSPFVQLMDAYQAWKAQQTPQVLPDSQGLTEENLAYLQERYSGTLSLFQRMEALDTLFEMGIINREERNAAWGSGGGMTYVSGGGLSLTCGPLDEESWFQSWFQRIQASAEEKEIQKTLDILYELLDKILEKPPVVTGTERVQR